MVTPSGYPVALSARSPTKDCLFALFDTNRTTGRRFFNHAPVHLPFLIFLYTLAMILRLSSGLHIVIIDGSPESGFAML